MKRFLSYSILPKILGSLEVLGALGIFVLRADFCLLTLKSSVLDFNIILLNDWLYQIKHLYLNNFLSSWLFHAD